MAEREFASTKKGVYKPSMLSRMGMKVCNCDIFPLQQEYNEDAEAQTARIFSKIKQASNKLGKCPYCPFVLLSCKI